MAVAMLSSLLIGIAPVAVAAAGLPASDATVVQDRTDAAVLPTRSQASPAPSLAGGAWSALMPWPLVAVHAALLRTGRVLVWDAWETGTV